jgi:hypothetical protein
MHTAQIFLAWAVPYFVSIRVTACLSGVVLSVFITIAVAVVVDDVSDTLIDTAAGDDDGGGNGCATVVAIGTLGALDSGSGLSTIVASETVTGAGAGADTCVRMVPQ